MRRVYTIIIRKGWNPAGTPLTRVGIGVAEEVVSQHLGVSRASVRTLLEALPIDNTRRMLGDTDNGDVVYVLVGEDV